MTVLLALSNSERDYITSSISKECYDFLFAVIRKHNETDTNVYYLTNVILTF